MKKALFVCTGNYYRSRFAEIYFNFKIKNYNCKAFSRGFDISNPNNTGLISKHVLDKLMELEIPLPDKIEFPLILKLEDLLQSEKIIALNENEHRPIVKKMFPEWEHKFTFWNVLDLYEEEASSSLTKLKFELDKLITDFHN